MCQRQHGKAFAVELPDREVQSEFCAISKGIQRSACYSVFLAHTNACDSEGFGNGYDWYATGLIVATRNRLLLKAQRWLPIVRVRGKGSFRWRDHQQGNEIADLAEQLTH